eukprot:g119.t1
MALEWLFFDSLLVLASVLVLGVLRILHRPAERADTTDKEPLDRHLTAHDKLPSSSSFNLPASPSFERPASPNDGLNSLPSFIEREVVGGQASVPATVPEDTMPTDSSPSSPKSRVVLNMPSSPSNKIHRGDVRSPHPPTPKQSQLSPLTPKARHLPTTPTARSASTPKASRTQLPTPRNHTRSSVTPKPRPQHEPTTPKARSSGTPQGSVGHVVSGAVDVPPSAADAVLEESSEPPACKQPDAQPDSLKVQSENDEIVVNRTLDNVIVINSKSHTHHRVLSARGLDWNASDHDDAAHERQRSATTGAALTGGEQAPAVHGRPRARESFIARKWRSALDKVASLHHAAGEGGREQRPALAEGDEQSNPLAMSDRVTSISEEDEEEVAQKDEVLQVIQEAEEVNDMLLDILSGKPGRSDRSDTRHRQNSRKEPHSQLPRQKSSEEKERSLKLGVLSRLRAKTRGSNERGSERASSESSLDEASLPFLSLLLFFSSQKPFCLGVVSFS